MKLKPTEHEIQAAIVRWAELNAGRYPSLRLLFAIPNGGWRHLTTAAKLKAEGVRPGVPDLFLACPRYCGEVWAPGLFIEVKRGTMGRVREQQALWAGALRDVGYAVELVRSVEEGIAVLSRYLGIR